MVRAKTDRQSLAHRVAEAIEQALARGQAGVDVAVTVRGGCRNCEPGVCPECGHLFTGETLTIENPTLGKRAVSDRAAHYLKHGILRYRTGYVVHGEPVVVDIDVEELARYLNL
jgi:hypothetical protein